MSAEIRVLHAGEELVLAQVAADVFDNPVNMDWARAFLADPRHHLVVALDGDMVVGFVSAVDYLHPDKPPQLWINKLVSRRRTRGAGLPRRCWPRCWVSPGRMIAPRHGC